MRDIAIKAKKLNVWYNGLHALQNVNFELPKNKIIALIGASGSGKTTFLRTLNRMLDTFPSATVEGQIIFNKENILSLETDVIELRRKIGMVFQNPTPFPKSIYDNVSYGLEIQGVKKNRKGGLFNFLNNKYSFQDLEKSEEELDRIIVRSLKEANLWDEVKDRLHHSAFRLSGGQQQRLCIARAIAVRPQVLLLDEPCSDLDPISTKKIEELLINLKKAYTIVIVTHNMYQAKRISDIVGFFHLGELIEFGTTKKIFNKPSHTITKNYIKGGFG